MKTTYAGFFRRLVAFVVDGVMLYLLITAIMFVLLRITRDVDPSNLQHLSQIVGLSVGAIYSIYFWVNHNGATPGKKLMKIRIKKIDDTPLDYRTAIVRYIGSYVSAYALAIGYLWMIWDKEKQTWHDKFAKTVVIHEQ
jgi:uncharacterized RDD family membrane protein YckC